jgi:hypothetical protein
VLWALEGLAWSPAYLTRVCRVLLDLASRDNGGRWANRPSNTLAEIFSPWYPQTIASASQRIQVVDVLLVHNAVQARKMLRDLLPDAMATTMHTHYPYWRDWAVQWKPGTATPDYWLQVNAYAERFIDGTGANAVAWEEVLDMIERIPTPLLNRVVDGLRTLAAAELSADERQHLATVLRKKGGAASFVPRGTLGAAGERGRFA